VENCSAVVKRLTSHLLSHKIAPNSPRYKAMISKARSMSRLSQSSKSKVNISDRSSPNSTIVKSSPVPVHAGLEPSREAVGSDSAPDDSDVDSVSNTVSSVPPSEENDICLESGLDKCVKQFYMWMKSVEGGKKHEKSAAQHAAHIRTLLSLTQQNTVAALWNQSVLHTFAKYAEEKKYLPATKKSYLNSMKHFYSFATSAAGFCTEEDVKLITQMRERVSLWIAAYRKDSMIHRHEKMDADLKKLVTPQQLSHFRRSDPSVSAIKIIGRCADSLQVPVLVTQTDYVIVRDFLLTEIALANANRAGVLANMTVTQFEQARVVDGQYVISVLDHKTAATYGSAKVILSPSLHQWISVYAKQIREHAVSPLKNPPELFISWNGLALTSGQITTAVKCIWKKAGLGEEITLNILRKTAVSTIHQVCPDMSASLADLMCHRVSTAQKCYRLIERERSSVQASKKLSEALTESHQVPVPAAASVGRTAVEDSACTEAVPAGRYTWTEPSLSVLRTVFDNEIKSRSISLDTVEGKISENSILRTIGARKVYDRVRSEIRCLCNESNPSALPEECEEACHRVARMLQGGTQPDPPSDSATDTELTVEPADSACINPSITSHLVFSRQDCAALVKAGAPIIARGPIGDDRIKTVLSESFAGQRLLKNYSLPQLKNRLKYERRKVTVKLQY